MNDQEKKDVALVETATESNNPFLLLPPERRTEKVCKAAVKALPQNIRHVPPELLTQDLCLLAFTADTNTFAYVPDERKTQEFYAQALRSNLLTWHAIPQEAKTKDLCQEALYALEKRGKRDYSILAEISYADLCHQWLYTYLKEGIPLKEILSAVNPDYITKEIALEYVKAEPSLFIQLPERLKTEDMYRAAIVADAMVIQHLSLRERTWERCLLAAKLADSPRIAGFIPFADIQLKVLDRCTDYSSTLQFLLSLNASDMTQEVANAVFLKQPELFSTIPERLRDRDLCKAAVNFDGSFLRYVPKELKTTDLCMEAIQKSRYAIPYIRDDMKSEEFYLSLIREKPQNLMGIPAQVVTDEMRQRAINLTYGKDKKDLSVLSCIRDPGLLLQIFKEQDPKMMDHLLDVVPMGCITPEIATEAISKGCSNFGRIPEHAFTKENGERAVARDGSAILFVPKSLRTPEMFFLAEKQLSVYEAMVPDEIIEGDNIYSFAKKAERYFGCSLSLGEHKQLYSGKPVELDMASVNGVKVKDCLIQYNRATGKFSVHQQQQKHTGPQPFKKMMPRKGRKF